ncbi:sensor histidine kinase [Kibdelosporangium philippinense]|uniref:Sensor histidine kinase n=1 Tax=Kibdelosporangium philippinense TaxID=211113 RepID=A0ABS8Z4V4_9PSEU|nr:sensor histidine kinase [Kibdelosporangium philippinense]MCE7001780.1 sensor histidine kinase [Kibdelosporangium philippinense]
MEDQLERRWNRAWALAPYVVLGVACALSLAFDQTSWSYRLVSVAIVIGLALWHGWFIVAHPQWWERKIMAVYFVGLLAFTSVLVLRSDSFELFIPMCYVLAFVALPGWWAYVGAVLANTPWFVLTGPEVLNFAVLTPFATLLGWSIRTIEKEAIRRRETNDKLVAMAAENTKLHALLVERAKETGVVEERARMAREIHDTVAQGLTGIVTQLEAAEALTPAGPARSRLDTARQLARTSLVEVRRSIEALRPGPLHDARLSDAVEQAVTTWHAQHDIPATFTVTGTPQPMHAEVEITILRAVQETLANVGRHAQAQRVDVTLSYMEDVIVLDVRDDGTGFDPLKVNGFGLIAMRQRARSLCGTVEIESTPGAGTAVSVSVPTIEVDQ